MCLILFAHRAHAAFPLVLAANRDEAYLRPAAPAAFWPDHPSIYAGRDLEQGGTWLGLTLNGRLAAVTNYREGKARQRDRQSLSRGHLVSGYLAGSEAAGPYLERVARDAGRYRGFILIAGDLDRLYWLSNRGPGVEEISPGVHGLSNHLLDTPWPKIVRSRHMLQSLLGAAEEELIAGLFEILGDRSVSPDHELPDTGVGIERERLLSANFICDGQYGTRASTVLLVNARGDARFIERSHGRGGLLLGQTDRCFQLRPERSTIDAASRRPQSTTRSRES